MEGGSQVELSITEDSCAGGTLPRGKVTTERRILEATSGNINTLDSAPSNDGKRTRSSKLERRRSRQKGTRPMVVARREGRIDRRAALAVTRFQLPSDELTPYEQYRFKQSRINCSFDAKKGVWPDIYHDAFVDGTRFFGGLGKLKTEIDGFKYGSNELIGHYVCLRSGDDRVRKQISSHKQVIRNKFENASDDWTTKLLLPAAKEWKRKLSNLTDPPLNEEEEKRRLFAYIASLPPEIARPGPTEKGRLRVASGPRSRSEKPQDLGVWPVDFLMWLQQHGPSSPSSMVDKVHTYTVLSGRPAPSKPLDKIKSWPTLFPHLYALHADGAVACEIFSIEVALNMEVLNSSLSQSTLEAQFEIHASSAFAHHSWQCTTRFYSSGNEVFSRHHHVPQADAGTEDGSVLLQPPFLTDLWRNILNLLSAQRLHGNRREAEKQINRHLSNLSAVQELFATRDLTNVSAAVSSSTAATIPTTDRVAIFLWQFKGKQRGKSESVTRWRSVIPPASRILTTAPVTMPSPAPSSSLSSPLSAEAPLGPPIATWTSHGSGNLTEMAPFIDEAYESQPMFDHAGTEQLGCVPLDVLNPGFYPSFESDLSRGSLPELSLAADGFYPITSNSMSFDALDGIHPPPYLLTADETYDGSPWLELTPTAPIPQLFHQAHALLGVSEVDKGDDRLNFVFQPDLSSLSMPSQI